MPWPAVLRLLLVALALSACAPWRAASRPWAHHDPELRAYVERNAVPLTRSDGAFDMTPLGDAVVGRPLIALGESSHGVREIKLAQLAVIQHLAARRAPLTVLYELPFDFARDLDAHVQGHIPLPDLDGGLVGTDELRTTLAWIREHNADLPPADQIRLGGFDIFCSSLCHRRLLDYLAAVDPAHADLATRQLAATRGPWHEILADTGARARATLEQEKQHLLTHRDRYIAASDELAWDDAVHRLDLALANLDEALNIFPRARDRDRVMADNVERFRARARPGETLLLIAHSGHIAAGAQRLPNDRSAPPSMGEHLRDRHGRDYLPIHMTFRSGTFLAHRAGRLTATSAGHGNPLAVFLAPNPQPGTLEHLLQDLPAPALLDLRRLPPAGPVAAWFAWEQYARNLGASWRNSHGRWPLEEIGWTRLIPAQAFDLIVHLPAATPLVPL